MARRSSVLDALNAFNQTYRSTRGVMRDVDIARIARAKPEETTEYTPEEKQHVAEAILDSGGNDVKQDASGYTIGYQDGAKQTIAPTGATRTAFLGKTVDGAMTPEAVDSARAMAMADAEAKYDPARGLSLRMAARRDQREQKRDAEEDALKADQKKWWEGSAAGRSQSDYTSKLKAFGQARDAYQAKLKGGATPEQLGLPPQQPTQAPLTYLDRLNDTAGLMAVNAQHGKYDPATWMSLAKAADDVKKSGAVEALKALQAGDAEGAIKAWNASGQNAPIDPSAVIGVKPTKTKINGATVDTYALQVRQPDGSVMTLNAAQQLNAYDAANGLIEGHWKERADQRAGQQLGISAGHLALAQQSNARGAAAEGRAQAEYQQKTSDRNATRDVKGRLATTAGMTPDQVEAVKLGVLDAPGAGKDKYKVTMGDVTSALGTPAVDRNGKPLADPLTGRQLVNRNPKEEKAFFEWMRAKGITDTDKGLALYMSRKPQAAGAAKPTLAAGQVVDGMKYTGGDPRDKRNWKQVGGASAGGPVKR